MSKWTHDALASDLARSRRGNGEAVLSPLSLGSYSAGGRADVAAFALSWVRFDATIWEVKISRADFLGDVNAGKYQRYLPWCSRLYFAAPAGLLAKGEIPEGVGLVVRGEKGWSGVRAARRRDVADGSRDKVLRAFLMGAHPGPWNPIGRLDRLRRQDARELKGLVDAQGSALRKIALEAQDAIAERGRLRGALARELGLDPGDPALTDLPGAVEAALQRAAARDLPRDSVAVPKWYPGSVQQTFERLRRTLEYEQQRLAEPTP